MDCHLLVPAFVFCFAFSQLLCIHGKEIVHQNDSEDLIGRLLSTIERLEGRVKELEVSALQGQKEREEMRAELQGLSEKWSPEHGIAKRNYTLTSHISIITDSLI